MLGERLGCMAVREAKHVMIVHVVSKFLKLVECIHKAGGLDHGEILGEIRSWVRELVAEFGGCA